MSQKNDFTTDFLQTRFQEQHENKLREYEEALAWEMSCELGCVDDDDEQWVDDQDDFFWTEE